MHEVRVFRLITATKVEEGILSKATYKKGLDDKIIQASLTSGNSISEITERTIKAFQEDMKSLGNVSPTYEPKATEHIPEMIKMIQIFSITKIRNEVDF
jgi:cysteinyl-tRNA synthetase